MDYRTTGLQDRFILQSVLIVVFYFVTYLNPLLLYAQPGTIDEDSIETFPDTIFCADPPCIGECEIWKLTQSIDWTSPTIYTSGSPLYLGNNENNRSASQVFLPNQIISNKKIYIKGGFAIDIPLTFNNCEIIIDPSVLIIVDGGLNNIIVNVENTFIHGTYALWYAFDIFDGNTVKVSDSYIEDAYAGFIARGGSVFESNNTLYNRNLISIWADHEFEFLDDPQIIITESHFNCTSDLLPLGPWVEGMFDFPPDATSYAAIYSINTDISVTEFDCNFSSIGNHANGILSFGGDVTEMNVQFYNIQESEAYQYPFEGYGIAINLDKITDFQSYGNFLNTNGWDSNDIKDPNFRNVDYPLTLIGGYLNARFHYTENSITSVRGTRIYQLEVITNKFQHYSDKAVYWWNSPWPVDEAEISHNYFYGDEGSTGIYSSMNTGYVNRQSGIPYYVYNIIYNDFSGYGSGILSMQDRDLKIAYNDYSLIDVAAHDRGLRVSGGLNVNSINNQFRAASSPIDKGIGLEYIETDNSLIRCNNVKNWGIGYNWAGTNHLQIHANDAINDFLGWHYEEGSSTDVQDKTNNRWFPIHTLDVKAVHESGGATKEVSNSKIIVGSNIFLTEWHPSDPTFASPPTLVTEDWIYNPQQHCGTDTTFPQILSEADSLIAIGSGQGTSFPIAYQWMQELDLYSKIRNNGLTFPPTSVYYTFVEQCKGNNISDFYDAIQEFYHAFDFTVQEASDMASLHSDIKNLYSSVTYYDSLYKAGAISFSTLIQQRNSLYQQVDTKQQSLNGIIDSYQQHKDADLNSALNLFQSINTNNYLSGVYKYAYQIYARYFLQQLTAQDSSTIFSFDGACIEQYHDAAMIYQALSCALGNMNELVYGCSAPQQRSLREPAFSMYVYPNPVENLLYIKFNKPYTGEITIHKINGMLVKKLTVKNKVSSEIQIADLPAGMYILYPENGNIKPIKFIKL